MAAFFNKNSLNVLIVSGPDAMDFLQRLSTVNLKHLRIGQGAKCLFLTGTSEIIAPCFLIHRGDMEFFLLSPAETMPALAAYLERMHFAENFTLSLAGGMGYSLHGSEIARHLGWDSTLHTRTLPYLPVQKKTAGNSTLFFWPEPNANTFSAFLWLQSEGPANSSAATEYFREQGWSEKPEKNFWQLLEIQGRLPRYGYEWENGAKALDVGFLPWIHRDKGCYPGQEVVEKSLNLGHPARTLVLLEGPMAAAKDMAAQAPISSHGQEVGRITRWERDERGDIFALAVVKWAQRERGKQLEVIGISQAIYAFTVKESE